MIEVGSIVRLLDCKPLCIAKILSKEKIPFKHWQPQYFAVGYDSEQKLFIILQYQILLLAEQEELLVHPYDVEEEKDPRTIVKWRRTVNL